MEISFRVGKMQKSKLILVIVKSSFIPSYSVQVAVFARVQQVDNLTISNMEKYGNITCFGYSKTLIKKRYRQMPIDGKTYVSGYPLK